MKNFLLLASVALLASCSAFDDDDAPLKGDRISVLELQKSLQPDSLAEGANPITIPNAWHNEFWPQAGGYPNHSMQHLALNEGQFKEAWRASIGKGSTNEIPLIAQPVIVDNKVYTLDTDSHLSAFNTENGKRLWQISIRDEDEDDPVIGGGVAFSNAVLYVTTGYDELLAVNPNTGSIFWRKNLPSPSRAAPTIIDNRLFIATLDGRVLALNPTDGSLLWEYIGISETAGLVGAASPAVNYDIAVPVFSSGEVTALRVENGSVAWSDNLSNLRTGGGLSSLSDIKALPVIDQGIVIAISFGGRIVAIDERTGARLWQREFGGEQTPWVAKDFVYVLSSDNELVALSRETGAIRWVKPLDRYEDDDRDDKIMWSGPVLAGKRLLLAGTDGRLLEVVPETGELLAQSHVGKSFTLTPVVADKTLYLLSEDGTLLAFR